MKKDTIKEVILNIVNNMDAGNSDLPEDKLDDVLETLNKITNTENKLSKEQACKYLGVSRATFDNYVRSGKIPRGIKEVGFKEKFWTTKMLMNVRNEINR